MAEHGIAVKPPQPAKNSPAAACRSAGAGHCLVLALDLSWLLVVMSACFYPLRRASKSVRRSAYGAPYRRLRAMASVASSRHREETELPALRGRRADSLGRAW